MRQKSICKSFCVSSADRAAANSALAAIGLGDCNFCVEVSPKLGDPVDCYACTLNLEPDLMAKAESALSSIGSCMEDACHVTEMMDSAGKYINRKKRR